MTSGITIDNVANKIVGVVNRGAVNGTISTSGGTYTIPAGYHNGSGKVTGPTLASLVGSNVNLNGASVLLTGYTAYGVNGTKYTGSMPNNGALNWSGSNTTYGVAAGYYSGGTLDSRPSYTNGYNAGNTAGYSTGYSAGRAKGIEDADNRVNTSSANYKGGYNAGLAAGQNTATKLTKKTGSGSNATPQTISFSATSGKFYVAAMGGDPGTFNNFKVTGATVVSNLTTGDTPPNGASFARMVLLKATSSTIKIDWGDTGAYSIAAQIG